MAGAGKVKRAVARFDATCALCGDAIQAGMQIKTWGRGWVHQNCALPARARGPGRPWEQHIKRRTSGWSPREG